MRLRKAAPCLKNGAAFFISILILRITECSVLTVIGRDERARCRKISFIDDFEGWHVKNPVMIFAEWNEPHAAAVRWALAKCDVPSVIGPDVSVITKRTSIKIDGHKLAWWHNGDAAASKPRSVWFRRPLQPNLIKCQDSDKSFLDLQWKLFQKNFLYLGGELTDSFWINLPSAAVAAESKLVQLRAAQKLSLQFPETVITNHSEDVAQLIRRWGRIVYKAFYPHSWKSAAQGTYHSVAVSVLDKYSDLPEESIGLCPGIFQRYIEKSADVRVTIIGSKIFAVRIVKYTGEAYLDWRQYALSENMMMEPVQLGAVWERKLQKLMRSLGIVFGCIDLVVDREGNIFFLEVNQAGQFLFIEERLPEIHLLRAITAMLIEGRCDYSLNACRMLHFSDYEDSEENLLVSKSYDGKKPLFALEQ
ncbi:MAG TPA: hypothetical protein VFL78_01800 [Rhodanobacteraceae bacterium]|nr:hypothetical protein [Rhodanobacteraceae bacterium]